MQFVSSYFSYTEKNKQKFYSFFGKYQNYSITFVENICSFTSAMHSWNYWYFQHIRWNTFGIHLQKSKYPLFILIQDNGFPSKIISEYIRVVHGKMLFFSSKTIPKIPIHLNDYNILESKQTLSSNLTNMVM